jgi:hypothetical protein
MDANEQNTILVNALHLIAERCPRIVKACYWAGASAICLEETHHRQSFDLDFHTRKALVDVRPLLAELQLAFPDRFEVITNPDEFGSGFRGILVLSEKEKVTVEVLSNYQDVSDEELVESSLAPGMKRIGLIRFLADKIQCIVERSEARDLIDFLAIIRHDPGIKGLARELIASQDALILSERLLLWTDSAIRNDLKIYEDVNPEQAMEARDLLLSWIKGDD